MDKQQTVKQTMGIRYRRRRSKMGRKYGTVRLMKMVLIQYNTGNAFCIDTDCFCRFLIISFGKSDSSCNRGEMAIANFDTAR